jgi:hypothetical protein
VRASIVRFIESRVRLKVNAAKSAVARPEERHFLGVSLRREPMDGEGEGLLSTRSNDRLGEKIRQRTPRNFGNSLKECIRRINVSLRGWIGCFWICTNAEERTRHNLDAHIRRRVRALVLRQWKRTRFIARRLIKLGGTPTTAWRGLYQGRRSWWALSHSTPVDRGWPNAYFAKGGRESLEAQWRERWTRIVRASAQQSLDLR